MFLAERQIPVSGRSVRICRKKNIGRRSLGQELDANNITSQRQTNGRSVGRSVDRYESSKGCPDGIDTAIETPRVEDRVIQETLTSRR